MTIASKTPQLGEFQQVLSDGEILETEKAMTG
jgi:hypothetical protein